MGAMIGYLGIWLVGGWYPIFEIGLPSAYPITIGCNPLPGADIWTLLRCLAGIFAYMMTILGTWRSIDRYLTFASSGSWGLGTGSPTATSSSISLASSATPGFLVVLRHGRALTATVSRYPQGRT